jgi:hypothetical protein
VWVCVDDPNTPVVRVKLPDLLTVGERPVNVAVPDGARVMLVLYSSDGGWPASAGLLVVELQ